MAHESPSSPQYCPTNLSGDTPASFDADKLNWITDAKNCVASPAAEEGITTLLGPLLMGGALLENGGFEENSIHAVLAVVRVFEMLGYCCPAAKVPKDYTMSPANGKEKAVTEHKDGDTDVKRAEEELDLSRAIAYWSNSFSVFKNAKFEVMNDKNVKLAEIATHGEKPMWLAVRFEADPQDINLVHSCVGNDDNSVVDRRSLKRYTSPAGSKTQILVESILPLLEEEGFVLSQLPHARIILRGRDFNKDDQYLSHLGEEFVLQVETGGNCFNLGTLFTLSKRDRIVAKALCSFYCRETVRAGPTLELIQVAKEWQDQGIGSQLLNDVEAFFVEIFETVCEEQGATLRLGACNVKTDAASIWFQKRGFVDDGMGDKLYKDLIL